MNLAEQARVAHDQLQINRVQQAVVAVALEHGARAAKRLLAAPDAAAMRAIRILAATGDGWLTDDTILLDTLRTQWTVIRR